LWEDDKRGKKLRYGSEREEVRKVLEKTCNGKEAIRRKAE